MNIRICEWKDAERMLREGTFAAFLRMWVDRYPYRGRMKQVKEYKKMFDCTFKEATRLWHYCPRPMDVDFEIGEVYVLRREGCKYCLLHRKNGILTLYKQSLELKDVPFVLVAPERVIYERVCEKEELMKAGKAGALRKLAECCLDRIYRMREYKCGGERTMGSPFLFCEDEIWRLHWELKPGSLYELEMTIRIDRKGGAEEIEGTREAVFEYLEKYRQRQLVTRGAF